jgi:hypothetical protein
VVTWRAGLAVLGFAAAGPVAGEFAVAQYLVAFVGKAACFFVFIVADYLTSDIFAELLFIFVVCLKIFIIFFDDSTSKLPLG